MIFSRRGEFSVFLGLKGRPGPTEGKEIRGQTDYPQHTADFLNAVRHRTPTRANQEQVLVTIAVNQFLAPNETIVEINSSLASARIHFHEHRYGFLAHGDAAWQWSASLVHERDDLFRIQARRFLDLSAGRSPPACSLEDAIHTLEINLAALDSAGVRRVPIERPTKTRLKAGS